MVSYRVPNFGNNLAVRSGQGYQKTTLRRDAVVSGRNMGNQYERFFGLQTSLLGLVMSRARKIGWICDQLQKIVDMPQPHNVFGMSINDYWAAVERWNRQKPLNQGERIMEAVGPFYNRRPSTLFYSLKNPIDAHELYTLVHQGLFWAGMSGVTVVHEMPASPNSSEWKYLSWHLNEWMIQAPEFNYNFLRQTGTSSPVQLPPDFGTAANMFAAMEILRTKVVREVFNEPLDFSGKTRIPIPESQLQLLIEMQAMIEAAVWFKAIGYKRADAMSALLALYRNGNFPVAINRNGKVLVLCKQK